MTLAEYLASPQAREDVKALLNKVPWSHEGDRSHKSALTANDVILDDEQDQAWRVVRVGFDQEPAYEVYYRPDGERYTVTDLGEGYRAFRLRTGGTYAAAQENDMRKNACVALGGDGGVIVHPCGGAMELAFAKDADLPDAICRVMLASLRVAGVGR